VEETFQSQPDDPAKPAEGTIAPPDSETQEEPETVESTFDPGTGDLAEPETTDGQADGEAADNA